MAIALLHHIGDQVPESVSCMLLSWDPEIHSLELLIRNKRLRAPRRLKDHRGVGCMTEQLDHTDVLSGHKVDIVPLPVLPELEALANYRQRRLEAATLQQIVESEMVIFWP